jgi:hypothetical protein
VKQNEAVINLMGFWHFKFSGIWWISWHEKISNAVKHNLIENIKISTDQFTTKMDGLRWDANILFFIKSGANFVATSTYVSNTHQ